jgi:acyl-CoA thioesterase-1
LFIVGFIGAGAILYLLVRALLVWMHKIRFQNHWQTLFLIDKPNAIHLVVLGDSISQGVGATRIDRTFVGRSSSYISKMTGRSVKVENHSHSGATADQVLTQQIPNANFVHADIILLEIGANDTFRRTPDQYRAAMEQIISLLPLEKTVIADLPYVKSRKPYQQILEDLLKNQGAVRAKASIEFKGFLAGLSVTAGDFFHPNNRGYGLWFEAFRPGIDEVLKRRSLLKPEAK